MRVHECGSSMRIKLHLLHLRISLLSIYLFLYLLLLASCPYGDWLCTSRRVNVISLLVEPDKNAFVFFLFVSHVMMQWSIELYVCVWKYVYPVYLFCVCVASTQTICKHWSCVYVCVLCVGSVGRGHIQLDTLFWHENPQLPLMRRQSLAIG